MSNSLLASFCLAPVKSWAPSRRLARPKPLLLLLTLVIVIGAVAVAQNFRLFERAWFNWQAWRQPTHEQRQAAQRATVDVQFQHQERLIRQRQ